MSRDVAQLHREVLGIAFGGVVRRLRRNKVCARTHIAVQSLMCSTAREDPTTLAYCATFTMRVRKLIAGQARFLMASARYRVSMLQESRITNTVTK